MNLNRKLRRSVRNGKVVYGLSLPTAADPSPSAHDSLDGWLNRVVRPLSMLVILGSILTISGTLWLSIQYLTNPDVAFLLDAGFSTGRAAANHPEAQQPRSLRQIQADLERQGQVVGPPVVLTTEFGLRSNLKLPANILLSVRQRQPGRSPGIRELHLYRALRLPFLIRLFQRHTHFRLIHAIAVHGPSEQDLVALEHNPLLAMGSAQSLPLTQLTRYEVAPQPGIWLRLTGLKNEGSSVSTYGQVLYFDPDREVLTLMLNWSSPPGDFPRWQQVTGNAQPELVLNQSVGLEPQYSIYQLKMADGVAHQLLPIQLADPAIDDPRYAQSLMLARNGLWSLAMVGLQTVKQSMGDRWTAAAQTQLDYIQLHATLSQDLANQPAANAVQRILGYLMNGSWSAALDVYAADKAAGPELRELLLADSGRLTSRLDAALQVTPKNPDLLIWRTLFRQVRTSQSQALTWLRAQSSSSPALVKKAEIFLKALDRNTITGEPHVPLSPPKQQPSATSPEPPKAGGEPVSEPAAAASPPVSSSTPLPRETGTPTLPSSAVAPGPETL